MAWRKVSIVRRKGLGECWDINQSCCLQDSTQIVIMYFEPSHHRWPGEHRLVLYLYLPCSRYILYGYPALKLAVVSGISASYKFSQVRSSKYASCLLHPNIILHFLQLLHSMRFSRPLPQQHRNP